MILNVHELIKKYRILRGMTQKEVADKLGMTQSGYAKLERGDNKIDIQKWIQIISILKAPFNIWNMHDKVDKIKGEREFEIESKLEEVVEMFRDNKDNLSDYQKKIARDIFEESFYSLEEEKRILRESLKEDTLENAIKRHGVEFLYNDKK